MQIGFISQIIILVLVSLSIWAWTIIISKFLNLRRILIETKYFEEVFWSGEPLKRLFNELKNTSNNPMSNVFCSMMLEWEDFLNGSIPNNNVVNLESRIDRAAQIEIKKEVNILEKGLSFLSSLGTNGVIIGLFGTVIGVLDGFKAISVQQNTAIASILSESLITTALGIAAALPAALAYNKLMSDTNRYINNLEIFADEFCSIILRQFEDQQNEKEKL